MNTDPKHAVFSPDGSHLATASTDSTLRVWDAGTGTLVRELKRPGAAVQGAAFSPDGRYLASASTGYAVRLWDTATGAQLRLFAGHSNALAFSPDGRYLATAPNDRTLRMWDVATGPCSNLRGIHLMYRLLHFHQTAFIWSLPPVIAHCVCGMS